MKKTTLQKNQKIANNIMFYIYTHIDSDINIDELAKDNSIDRVYMQKIFKDIFGKNIYETIKSIRLQKASNLLLTNKYSTISEISQNCGYSSCSSFIRAFKDMFHMTPKEWRYGGYLNSINNIELNNFENIDVEICKIDDIPAFYIRHNGYNDRIKLTWQKIEAWLLSLGIKKYRYIALLHDNPAITPLDKCHYVACVDIEDNIKSSYLPKFKISGGVYAKFKISSKDGGVLNFTKWVYHKWLIENEFETTTKPPFVEYIKNEFLTKNGDFEANFYLPIEFV